jgi:hypothetical protein
MISNHLVIAESGADDGIDHTIIEQQDPQRARATWSYEAGPVVPTRFHSPNTSSWKMLAGQETQQSHLHSSFKLLHPVLRLLSLDSVIDSLQFSSERRKHESLDIIQTKLRTMFPASINPKLNLAAELLLDWFWEGQEVKRSEDRLYLTHEASRAVSYCLEVLTERKCFQGTLR